MYQQDLATQELHLQLNTNDLARLEIDAQETERNSHIGTHIDCFMKAPRKTEYVIEAAVVDCRNGLPDKAYFQQLDLEQKALVLYTGNMATNGYATREFFAFDMHMDQSLLQAILQKRPRFILIDSYGLGRFSQHRTFELECEQNGCFLIMCLVLKGEEVLHIEKLKIEIDLSAASTGKPCHVYPF